MKLKQEFITHQTDAEAVLIPTGKAEFSGILRGNRTLGMILSLLTLDRTEEEIVSTLLERCDASREQVSADVRKAVECLREIGALDE